MKNMFAISLLLLSFRVESQINLNLKNYPEKLSMLSPGKISTQLNERDFAISPDGSEIYYTISTPKSTFQTIVYSRRVKDDVWTEPVIAPFAGEFSDLEPAFSPDGKTLYFASNRPVNGTKPKDFDIWKVSREKSSWGRPENLGVTINSESDEFFPSIAKSGNLYFTAQYKNGIGREDIFVAIYSDQSYRSPVPLDTAVNSRMYEFNAFVSPDEDYILFTSYGRKDDSGGGDLYMSLKDANGKWMPAKNLKELNSPQLDYCPYVSPDGKILFLTSERHELPVSFTESKATIQKIKNSFLDPLNGTGNIYWIDFRKVKK